MLAIIHSALYFSYLSLFLWLIFRWKFFETEGVSKKLFAVFFLLKVVAGIILTVIYTYYYTDPSKADIYRYFNDSKIISSLMLQHPLVWLHVITGIGVNESEVFRHLLPTLFFSHPESDIATNNSFLIRVISLFNYFSYYNIYINTLFFNFASFIGLTVLFKAIRKYFVEFPQLLLIPIYLLPSVIFWGSGMLKEQFAFIFIGVFFHAALIPGKKRNYTRWMALILILYILYCIKPSIAFCLFASLLFLPVVNISPLKKISISVICIAVFAIIFFVLKPNWGNAICEQLINKRNEFVLLSIIEKAGSYFDDRIYPADCADLFSLIPKALFDSILRPLIWQGRNLFQLLFAVENLLFILTILFLLLRFLKIPERERLLPALSFFVFALLNYLIIGLTVPITGAVVHYRIIATTFLLITILLFLDHRQLKTFMASAWNKRLLAFK